VSPTSAAGISPPEILLTHGHDDHTGSAGAPAERTGARVIAARDEAPTISGDRPPAPPVLLDWEIPLFESGDAQRPACGTGVARPARAGRRATRLAARPDDHLRALRARPRGGSVG
jgi:hypothetical protein